MCRECVCPGLPGHWINGWLAAVGITVLDPRIRLRWTAGADPIAVLSADNIDPIFALVESWPGKAFVRDLPIAENWDCVGRMQRKVAADVFAQRVRAARGHPSSWTLSSTMTDLCVTKVGEVEHAPFDPAGPGTTKWLHHRFSKLHSHVQLSEARLRESMMGYARRVKDNGLGFDQTRFGSLCDETTIWVDPVIEVLVFFGLALFPVRGPGVDQRIDRAARTTDKRQRGWLSVGQNARRFCWPAWTQPLDRAGIDALMDAWNPLRESEWQRLGVHAGWRSVKYDRRSAADSTRAFGGERL